MPTRTSSRSKPSLDRLVKNIRNLSEYDFVRDVFEIFEPEFERLRHAESTIETSDSPTIGGLDSNGLTPSRLKFGEDYQEVNRTSVSLLCLKWLVDRNYNAFTANQPSTVKMSQDSFDLLCGLVDNVIRLHEFSLTALVVAIVVGDIGKDPELEREVQQLGVSVENHDEVVYQAAKRGLIEPLKWLPLELRKDVELGLKVGSSINVPQLAQAENVPGNLQEISILRDQERAFSLKYIEIILDVAGAGGHVDSRSATRMIEPVFRAFASCRSALENIIEGKKSIRQGYDQVLQQRGKLLDSNGVRLLKVDVPAERALLRLMCMGRIDGRERAELMIEAFDTLRNTTRQHLIDGLSVDGLEDGEAIVMYYMPGLFAEAFKNTKDSGHQKKVEALRSLMRFMTRIYGGSRPHPNTTGSVIVVNVGSAAKIISSDKFRTDPGVLDNFELRKT